MGKAINRALGRTGRVFDDRHHRHVLRTPAEVRYAKAYVLMNRRRHLAFPTPTNYPLEERPCFHAAAPASASSRTATLPIAMKGKFLSPEEIAGTAVTMTRLARARRIKAILIGGAATDPRE